jgi:hypothetical protein
MSALLCLLPFSEELTTYLEGDAKEGITSLTVNKRQPMTDMMISQLLSKPSRSIFALSLHAFHSFSLSPVSTRQRMFYDLETV